jgi:chromosome segregation ATPase
MEQHENIKQHLIKQEAKHVAEEIRQNDVKSEMMKSLQDELIERKQEITSLASVLETERSEHARKVKDLEFLLEQLTSNENKVKDLVNEVQKQQKENGSLRTELAAERKRIEEKMAEFQREERTKSAEIDSLASMIDAERRAHSQKIEQLNIEIKKKASEVNALSTMLEKEQTSHEKTINDTQKHFAKLEEVENKNDTLEEEAEKLKSKMRKMKAELTRQEQENNELLQRSKQMTMDELEEVQHLNRSLTQAEIHKGKLLREVESSKEELQKTQGRYNKTRDKLKTVKQKWHKDHSKLEEILHSPRVDMGLQTSLIEPEELEVTKTQLSDSMRANTRLMEELKGSKGNLDGFKNDMHALKRANNILIKQNQVLYLETEGYKKNVDTLTLKMDQLREVSIKLTTDNEKLELENKGLNERLERTEVNLSKAEGEKSSIDALNESSQSELEESKINCYKLEEENARQKNQNDFLLSQAKRLQERVDELENEIKQLKRDLLVKEVDIINKERLVSAMQSEKLDSMLLSSSVPGPLFEHESFNDNRTHRNHNGVQGKHNDISESRRERTPSIDGSSQKQDLVSHIQSLKDSVGNNADGDKGYVGIKSYQVLHILRAQC